MDGWQTVTWRAAGFGQWAARILGTLLVLLFLAFFFGEGPPSFSTLTSTEKLQFLGMAGMVFGLILAWKWEGMGGLLTVAGFGLLVAISQSHLRMWAFWVPAGVGVVHVVCWARLKVGPPAMFVPWHFPRGAILGMWAALAVFVLLAANEMFGMPPLMTPALRPVGDLAGTWQARMTWVPFEPLVRRDVVFVIQSDGSVTGTVGDLAVADARIMNNRSWFGKLLHWRTDYLITGRLAGSGREPGRQFRAGFNREGQSLSGGLVLKNRATSLRLEKQ